MNLGVKRLLALLMSVCVLMSTSLSMVALAATLEEEIALDFGNIAWEKRTIGGSERDVCVVEITAASKANPTFEARDIEMYVGFDKTVLNYYRHEEGQIAPYEVLDEFGDPVKTTTMDASTNRANSNNNGCVFALIIDSSTDHSGNHVIQSGQVILKLLFMPQEGMEDKPSEISFKIPSDATDYASKKNFVALANEDTYTLDDTAVATVPALNPPPAQTYTIEVTGGAANPAGPVEAGTQVTITAADKGTPPFKAWTGLDGVEFVTGDASASTATFKMPEKDLTVTATYDAPPATTYKIEVTDGAANPAGPVEAGTQVTITAADKGTQPFKAWTGLDGVEFVTGDASASTATFKMPEKDLTVTATYDAPPATTYKIEVTDGTANPTGPVEAGTQVTITAAEKENQPFKAWTGLDGVEFVTGDANKSPATFKMPANDLTVTATYDAPPTTTYKISVTDGTADPAGPVEAGTQVTVTADTKDGQAFKGWTGLDGVEFVSGDASASPATFKMPDRDLTVKAEFEEVTEEVTITFDPGEGSGTMDPQKAPKGKPFTMPQSGFKTPDKKSFDGWKIPNNDALVAAGVQFTFDADTTVTAQYKDNTNNGGNGGGGCYVATAVYGSYDCPEVWTLRRFRDEVLADTWYGRLFIRLYYTVSPTAVRLFGESEWFQNFWREKLDSMVQDLQDAGFESTPYQDTDW